MTEIPKDVTEKNKEAIDKALDSMRKLLQASPPIIANAMLSEMAVCIKAVMTKAAILASEGAVIKIDKACSEIEQFHRDAEETAAKRGINTGSTATVKEVGNEFCEFVSKAVKRVNITSKHDEFISTVAALSIAKGMAQVMSGLASLEAHECEDCGTPQQQYNRHHNIPPTAGDTSERTLQ